MNGGHQSLRGEIIFRGCCLAQSKGSFLKTIGRTMLNGTRIIEFEALGPAPFASMMLAELGAEVITIHRASAANTPAKSDSSLLDTSKKSIVLDLKKPEDVTLAKALVQSSDGLIEGLRPGVMERLGLGPADIHAIAPKVIYGRMTGWGQSGPRALQAGHDLNYISLSGAAWYASNPNEAPFTPPTLVGDIGGGALYLVIGMLAGLLHARETGHGCVVDAAIVDGSAHMMNLLMSLKALGGLSETRGGSLLDGPHWSRTYACSDGKYMSVQCLEPKFYQEFLTCLGLETDLGFGQQFHAGDWPVLTARLAGVFAAHPQSHWIGFFAGSDACVAPVLSPQQASTDPHIAERRIWRDQQGHLRAALAPRFSNWTPQETGAIPEKDEHRDHIIQDLQTRGLL